MINNLYDLETVYNVLPENKNFIDILNKKLHERFRT